MQSKIQVFDDVLQEVLKTYVECIIKSDLSSATTFIRIFIIDGFEPWREKRQDFVRNLRQVTKQVQNNVCKFSKVGGIPYWYFNQWEY